MVVQNPVPRNSSSQLSHIECAEDSYESRRSRPTQQHRCCRRSECDGDAETSRQAYGKRAAHKRQKAPEDNAWDTANRGSDGPERENRREQDARSGYGGNNVEAKLRAQPDAINPVGSVTPMLARIGS